MRSFIIATMLTFALVACEDTTSKTTETTSNQSIFLCSEIFFYLDNHNPQLSISFALRIYINFLKFQNIKLEVMV